MFSRLPTFTQHLLFYFSTGLRGGEGGGRENIFLLLLKNFQDPLAVRNSLRLSLDGGTENKNSGISVIKCQ